MEMVTLTEPPPKSNCESSEQENLSRHAVDKPLPNTLEKPRKSATSPGPLEKQFMTLDRLRGAKSLADDALKNKKIFMIYGPYASLRAAFRRRGWVEQFCPFYSHSSTSAMKPQTSTGTTQPASTGLQHGHSLSPIQTGTVKDHGVPSKNGPRNSDIDSSDDDDDDYGINDNAHESECSVAPWEEDNGYYGVMSRMVRNTLPTFIWSVRGNAFPMETLADNQMINYYRHASFTSKVGLCTTLRNLPWFESLCPDEFFPRCYRLSHEEERQMFIDDFFLTCCVSLLRRVVEPLPYYEVCNQRNNSSRGDLETCRQRTSSGSDSFLLSRSKILEWAVSTAVIQCEHHLNFLEHEDIDHGDLNWDEDERKKFLHAFYQVSEGKFKAECPSNMRNRIRDVLSRIHEKSPQYEMDGTCSVWIVKPGAKSRGRGIQCYRRLEDMLKLADVQVGQGDNKFVVQKYIERPLLIYGTKFDIRQWFLVTDWNPFTLWFYRNCYLRFCSQAFSLVNLDEATHLSNNAIQQHYKNGDRAPELPKENMWTMDEFKQYLTEKCGFPADVWSTKIYPGMLQAVYSTLLCSQDNVENRKNSYALYGADFMLTEDLHPWLIEINSSPCMAPTTKITAEMCAQVLDDMLKVVIDRKADKTADTGLFELVRRHPQIAVPPYIGTNLQVDGQTIRKPGCTKADEPAKAGIRRKKSATDIDDSDDSSDGAKNRHAKNDRKYDSKENGRFKCFTSKKLAMQWIRQQQNRERLSADKKKRVIRSKVRKQSFQLRAKTEAGGRKRLVRVKKINIKGYVGDGNEKSSSSEESADESTSKNDPVANSELSAFAAEKNARPSNVRNIYPRRLSSAYYQKGGDLVLRQPPSEAHLSLSNKENHSRSKDNDLNVWSDRASNRWKLFNLAQSSSDRLPQFGSERRPQSDSGSLSAGSYWYTRSRTLCGSELSTSSHSYEGTSQDRSTNIEIAKPASARYVRDLLYWPHTPDNTKHKGGLLQKIQPIDPKQNKVSEPQYILNITIRKPHKIESTGLDSEGSTTGKPCDNVQGATASQKVHRTVPNLSNGHISPIAEKHKVSNQRQRSMPTMKIERNVPLCTRRRRNTPVSSSLEENIEDCYKNIVNGDGLPSSAEYSIDKDVERKSRNGNDLQEASVIHITMDSTSSSSQHCRYSHYHGSHTNHGSQHRQPLPTQQQSLQLDLAPQTCQRNKQQQKLLERAAYLRALDPKRSRAFLQPARQASINLALMSSSEKTSPLPSYHVSLVNIEGPLRKSSQLSTASTSVPTGASFRRWALYNSYHSSWKQGGFVSQHVDINSQGPEM